MNLIYSLAVLTDCSINNQRLSMQQRVSDHRYKARLKEFQIAQSLKKAD
jgi:hypothetical protein